MQAATPATPATPAILATRAERADILRAFGARATEVDELLAYGETGFDAGTLTAVRAYPLVDEPFVEAWSEYARQSARDGVGVTLTQHLVQLHFPIEAGMSARAEYQAAIRGGTLPLHAPPPRPFVNERGMTIRLHPTAAGRVPLLIAEDRSDFERLVRTLGHRNEPVPIPASMGACIVGGFRRVIPRRESYLDRFVILSSGAYSATSASAVGLSNEEWRRLSLVIRTEHECAHYFTRRVFGSMRNALLDELIADYTGIVAARGRFEPDWLRRFMGVEHPAAWRPDGRLANYRGNPPLSDGAFGVLQTVVRRAANTLADFDCLRRSRLSATSGTRSLTEVAQEITALAVAGLERLAAGGIENTISITRHSRSCSAGDRLEQAICRLSKKVRGPSLSRIG